MIVSTVSVEGGQLREILVYLTGRGHLSLRGVALTVSLDRAKTFDRVWHKTLLSKGREIMQVDFQNFGISKDLGRVTLRP